MAAARRADPGCRRTHRAACVHRGQGRSERCVRAIFLRALDARDKAATLRSAIGTSDGVQSALRFDVDVGRFRAVPRSPFAYWVTERLRKLFTELEPFSTDNRAVKQGLATADDFRFVRAW